MTPHADAPGFRRYLLGEATDAERESIEGRYFDDESVASDIAAEEESLIEEYLAGRLGAEPRNRFEAHYLASPVHRQRVELLRRLSATAGGGAARNARRGLALEWLAAAATIALAVAGAWSVTNRPMAPPPSEYRGAGPAPAPNPAPASPPEAATPRAFAFSLSPILTRSDTGGAVLVIPPGTDVVRLRLEGAMPGVAAARADVRTIGGSTAQDGPVTRTPDGSAALDVPADRLTPDDYIVRLVDAGSGRELYRYFLRVRAN